MLRLLPDRLVETWMQGLDRSDCFWDSGGVRRIRHGFDIVVQHDPVHEHWLPHS